MRKVKRSVCINADSVKGKRILSFFLYNFELSDSPNKYKTNGKQKEKNV